VVSVKKNKNPSSAECIRSGFVDVFDGRLVFVDGEACDIVTCSTMSHTHTHQHIQEASYDKTGSYDPVHDLLWTVWHA